MHFLPIVCVVASATFLTAPHVRFATSAADLERANLQRHYFAVLEELESAPPAALTPAQRDARAERIAELRAYAVRGTFGVKPTPGDGREPVFRDASGRLCAVANLLDRSGREDLVEVVARARNDAWINDLRGEPGFLAWLDASGLTLEEAARIQGPVLPVAPSEPTQNRAWPPSETSGGSSTPGNGSGRPGGGGSAAPAPAGPAASTPAIPSVAPTVASVLAASDTSWWVWWEYNKLEFLAPNALGLEDLPATSDDVDREFRNALERERDERAPLFERLAKHSDALVRDAAGSALARVNGDFSALFALLADANVEVRNRAILALGGSAVPETQEVLLSIARTGCDVADGRERISQAARPLAIVALGLGRRTVFDACVDREVAEIVAKRPRSEREALGIAACIYHTLAPSAELETVALELALDDDEPTSVRCRAIESLSSSTSPEVLSELASLLVGSDLEARRSASLALGLFPDRLAVPSLMTAIELEKEPLARAFALVSLGRQGGKKACAFLEKRLERGDSALRPWSALALGIALRPEGDAHGCKALRAALERERNRDWFGAYWLALGLARDAEAVELLRGALESNADPRQRMYAANALALVGNEPAREALREQLTRPNPPLVRAAIAQSLGVLGRAADAEDILDVLHGFADPELQVLASTALAFHGSNWSLAALDALATIDGGSSARRAASIDGLAMMLGRGEVFALARASRQSNFTLYGGWVANLFQTSL